MAVLSPFLGMEVRLRFGDNLEAKEEQEDFVAKLPVYNGIYLKGQR